jgi:phospholipid-transporting ATPase
MYKFNIPDATPRMELFKKQVQKVRVVQRSKRNRGFAFSQNEDGEAHLIRIYDTTRYKPSNVDENRKVNSNKSFAFQ